MTSILCLFLFCNTSNTNFFLKIFAKEWLSNKSRGSVFSFETRMLQEAFSCGVQYLLFKTQTSLRISASLFPQSEY
ncbi:hypothetical protein D1970_16810 [Mesobacillus zeae]|uniref:Uncharacterized protein n=1 Tax=Mesobacillus zeae TaxID=1917180 RepID=A0A398AZU1_9BACI|nr:hypothetical protein D1970_16810 [Mesobacillus zeae]